MRIYAIGDIHLSFRRPVDPGQWENVEVCKPMDIFGEKWRYHYRKIYENWVKIIRDEDLVLVPGDISWAMNLSEAKYDLDFLGLLPGTVVCVAGNHDYWWRSLSQVRAALPRNMAVIQNDHFQTGPVAICGSRGWLCPGAGDFGERDLKIYRRELIRMENSLKKADAGAKYFIAMTHYMPANDRHEKNELIDMFIKYGVRTVVYSHLHSSAARLRLPDNAWGIDFHLVSADFLDFKPALIMETSSNVQ